MGNRIFGRELDGALERRDGSGQVALCFEDAPELDVDICDFGIQLDGLTEFGGISSRAAQREMRESTTGMGLCIRREDRDDIVFPLGPIFGHPG